MSLAGVPSSERVHIGFFGMRNAGKSSLINAVAGQSVSIVSDTPGTTTDPVTKTMEILPIGPVVLIDTPGLDDLGELGRMRVKKAYDMLVRCDVVVVVIDGIKGKTTEDDLLINMLLEKKVPHIICYNKADKNTFCKSVAGEICVSAKDGLNITELKNKIAEIVSEKKFKYIIGDKVDKGDIIVLVIPIDEAAPKGRLILPQQLVLREVLDSEGICICVQPEELSRTLATLNSTPKLIITDSQAFSLVEKNVPENIPLTSFSILFMNYKGELSSALMNVSKISNLNNGDKILIAEGCTHHKQCNDIGSVKIPRMLKEYTNTDLVFDFCSGRDFPEDLSSYSLVIHCGGCMLTENEVRLRQITAQSAGVPITNYGVAMAYMNGILSRATEIFDI